MSGLHGADGADADPAAARTSFEDLSSELLASSFVSGTQMAKVLAENRRLRQELDETKKELDNAKKELQYKEMVKKMIDEDAEMHTRYWLPEEHQRFLVGLQKFGHKDMKAIAEYVGTRSTVQVRTHAQKYFLKLERHGKSLGDLGLLDGASSKDGDEEESACSPPNSKRARSSPEKTSSPSGSKQGGGAEGKQPANSQAVPSVHQSRPMAGDPSAFARVPNEPPPNAPPNSSAVLNQGYNVLGAAGFDVAAPAGVVSGLDVGRGGLMFPQAFPTNPQGPPPGAMQDAQGAGAMQGGGMQGGGMQRGGVQGGGMQGGGMQGWNMPGARPVVNHPAAIQLAQPWHPNQMRMPQIGGQVPPGQAFPVAGQQGPGSHGHSGPHHGGPGQQDHLTYLQNLQ